MTTPAQPVEVVPAPVKPADDHFISLWDFFQTFVAAQNLALPLKEAHREACDLLQDAVTGYCDKEFIIVNIPPRVGKTKLMEALALWMWAYFPEAQMIYTGYNANLVGVSLSYISQCLRSPWYIDLFGDIVHSSPSGHITTMFGGNLYGEGIGGALTGKGAGLKHACGGYICIDDPAKPDEALSPVVSESTRQWFETTLKDRRNSDRFCPIIICAQRLAPMDLPGYVMETYPNDFKLVKFKALLDDGTSAFPETISAKTLQAYKATRIGRFVLASKYQQEPTSLGGNLIQTDSFVRFALVDVVGWEWEEMFITVDTAMKIKEANDFSCFQLWGKMKQKGYLLDMIHGKWESPALLSNAIVFSNKCRDAYPMAPLRMVIEEKAAGIGLIQQLNVAHVPAEGIERDIDKVRRVQAILPYQESGLICIPNEKREDAPPWVAKFLNECAEFKPDGTHLHDDMVDAMCDGASFTCGRALSILDVLGGKAS